MWQRTAFPCWGAGGPRERESRVIGLVGKGAFRESQSSIRRKNLNSLTMSLTMTVIALCTVGISASRLCELLY